MVHIASKKQSIRPPVAVIIGALIAALAMAAVWLAVTTAVSSGGQDCPAKDKASTGKRCR